MLNHSWIKRRYNHTKISKIFKFDFFKIDPKSNENHLQCQNSKETIKKAIWDDIWTILETNPILKEESAQTCSEIFKIAYFLNFTWICGQYQAGIDRFVAGGSRSTPKFFQKIFCSKRTKIEDFIPKKHTHTPLLRKSVCVC